MVSSVKVASLGLRRTRRGNPFQREVAWVLRPFSVSLAPLPAGAWLLLGDSGTRFSLAFLSGSKRLRIRLALLWRDIVFV